MNLILKNLYFINNGGVKMIIDDMEKIYYSIKCETENNEKCCNCKFCKNKKLCNKVWYLIYSLKDNY